jgi:beta-glucanase (GH16 family)
MHKNISWSGYEWITRERWGNIHADKLFCHYNPKCVYKDDYEYLHLLTKKDPKKFKIKQGDNQTVIESPIGVGLVSSKEKFGYGYYEIEAKLPLGENLWPAFWMWSWDGWPPEIDVFEGYTDNRKGYLKFNRFNPFGFYNVQSNFHYKDIKTSKNANAKAKTHYFGLKNPTTNFIKYGLKYLEDEITIFYNGRAVRSLPKPLLQYFRGHQMNVIINNSVSQGVDETKENYSDFVIKYFKYEPL